jgi:hypothetical protein
MCIVEFVKRKLETRPDYDDRHDQNVIPMHDMSLILD